MTRGRCSRDSASVSAWISSTSSAPPTASATVPSQATIGLEGTFEPPLTFAVGASPGGLAVGDLDDDGIADVVVTHPAEGTIGVLVSDA